MNLADIVPIDGEPACRWAGVDPEWWFRTDEAARTEAARLCRQCSFRERCAEYALAHSVEGYWGGLSEEERRQIRARAGLVARPIVDDTRPLWQQVMDMHNDGVKGRLIADALGVSKDTVYTTISRYRDGKRAS